MITFLFLITLILHQKLKKSNMCNYFRSILELVRTHFAAAGGEEVPPRNSENATEPRRWQFSARGGSASGM